MFVLIAGGGLTAAHLATLLVEQNHQVRLIEHRRDVLTSLHRELPTEIIYEGFATDPQVLEQAGIREADVLAACTSNDVENLVLCFFGRTRYHVPRTIARINNPRNAWLFDQKFHVDVALNQAEILATLIEEEMSLGDMKILLATAAGPLLTSAGDSSRSRTCRRGGAERPAIAAEFGDRCHPPPGSDSHSSRYYAVPGWR